MEIEPLYVGMSVLNMLVLIVQTGALWKWAGRHEATVEAQGRELDRHEGQIAGLASNVAELATIIARLEQQLWTKG